MLIYQPCQYAIRALALSRTQDGNEKMNCRITKVLAGVLVLLMSLTVPLSLSFAVAAEPVEAHTTLPSIGTAVAMASVVRENSNVYVIGGALGVIPDIVNVIDTVQIYNITTGETTYGTNMPTGTAAAAYGQGPDGKIYIAGGWNSTSSSYLMRVQIYDPALDSWSLAANFTPEPIGRSASVMGVDGKLYAFGGGWSTNTTLIYDLGTDHWVYGHDLPTTMYDSAAVAYNATEIILIGGSGTIGQSYAYNPVNNTWTNAGALAQPTDFGSAVVARSGFVYLFGGSATTSMSDPNPLSRVQRYDASRQTWELSDAYLNTGRMHVGAVNDAYGRILVVAGWDGSSVVGTVEAFVVADTVSRQSIQIVGPTDGSIVSGVVPVDAMMVGASIWTSYMAIDFSVDGVWRETQFQVPEATFLWDTTALADGSQHTLMVRGYAYDGTVNDASVTVTVSAQSLAEKVAALEQAVAVLQTKLNLLNSSVEAIQIDINALQAQLNLLKTNQTTQSVKLDELQTQLNDIQSKLDKAKTSSDNGSMLGIVTIVLIVVVLALLAMMFMASRKKP